MIMHMQHISAQEASVISSRSGFRGGRSFCSRLSWRPSKATREVRVPTLCAPRSSLCQSSRLFVGECRFTRSAHLSRKFRKTVVCNLCSQMYELSNAASLGWEPAIDNLLLIFSIALAYIAGIVTPSSPPPRFATLKERTAHLETSHETPKVYETITGLSSEEDFWTLVRLKLISSMDVGENETDEMEALNTEQAVRLSLQALAKGPRLRLLLITLEQLNKEVLNFQENGSHLRQDWSEFFIQRICDIIIPICRLWIFGEHKESLENGHVKIKDQYTVGEHFDQNLVIEWNSLFDSYPEGYGGYKTMKRSLMATGKAEFYAEFLYSSCSGSLRRNSFCGTEMHSNEVVSVLEDLIINVADKAAALYLDLISNGGSICNWQWSNIMSKSISSTRLLEKFRNEVALNGWLNDNFQSVTAMFEDRFDLWILKSHEDDSNNEIRQVQKVGVIHKKQNPEARKYSVVSIRPSKLFARRGKELRALTGWRYYFSLYLEFSDISGPILRTIITKLGEGISFLLVILIGRSLGLIYRGIRQSLQWNSS